MRSFPLLSHKHQINQDFMERGKRFLMLHGCFELQCNYIVMSSIFLHNSFLFIFWKVT